MILLDGHSLTAKEIFEPVSFAPAIQERDGSASMVLGPEHPQITIGDWMQDNQEPGAGTVWRVKTIDRAYENDQRTVQLEHIINTLKDCVMFGEVTAADITGSSGATTCTAQQAAAYVIGRQSDWTLGTFGFEMSAPFKFNGETVYDALGIITSAQSSGEWTLNTSVYPFVISIATRSNTVTCELREGRNLQTIKKTIDRTRMATRVYPIGYKNLHITGEYVSKNEGTYGRKDKILTDNSIQDQSLLLAAANDYLDNHAEPIVTITVTGLELSDATGESLDALGINKQCRIPMPEYGTVITERITKIQWKDKIRNPEEITITMANNQEDVARIISDISKSSGRSGRNKAKEEEEDHAWFVDTTDHVAMVAEAVAGKDDQGNPNWSRVSEIIVSGDGIYSAVTAAESEIVQAQSQIEQNDREIRATVSAAQSSIYSVLHQTASNIYAQIVDTEEGLTNYINNTASGTRQIIANTTNRIWIQEYDPTTEAGGSHTVKDGDQWVKSTHQGTWDGADGFDWEHNEPFDWYDVQGAQVYGWANNKWELISDQQQVVTYSDVIETADIYVRRYINNIVNDEGLLDVYLSKLQQTATEIRAEVTAANSAQYSYIDQTASQINIGVGNRPTAIMQSKEKDGEPIKVNGRDPVLNDIWIDTENIDTWEDAIDYDWDEEEELDWNKLRSDRIFVWDGEKWHLAEDGTVLTDDTDLQIESNHISLLARNIDTLDGYARENFAELRVEASRIRSTVLDKTNQLGSQITQTASQIRSEVWATGSQMYSRITQTATEIRSEVVDAVSGLSSVISQTASQIRSEVANSISNVQSSISQTAAEIRAEVSASNSSIYSSITQTASQIRSEVASSISGVQSSITQNANKIALVVNGSGNIKAASIVTAINNAGSSVTISADKILLDGSTTLHGALQIQDGSLFVSENLVVSNSASGNMKVLNIGNNGSITFADAGGNVGTQTLNVEKVANLHTDIQVVASGNGYKLQRKRVGQSTWEDIPNSTFSRAISTWTLGGGNGYVNVTALPQNQMKPVQITIDGTNTITSNGTFTYKACYVNADGDDVETGTVKTVTVNVSGGGGDSLTWDAFSSSNPMYNTVRSGSLSSTVFLNLQYPDSSGTVYARIQVNDQYGTKLCEDTIDFSKISITRAGWHSTSGNVYKGTLYYWDDDDGSYQKVVNGSYYWYYSSSSKSGTTTVYYY